MWQWTIEDIGGSNVPYRGSTRRCRVTVQHFRAWLGNKSDPRSVWVPVSVKEEQVRKVLLAMTYGFTEHTYPVKDKPADPSDYYATRLNYLKEIEPGIWEWETHTPYTD